MEFTEEFLGCQRLQTQRILPMQGQRGYVDSLPETLEFDHMSSSSSAGMDHDIYRSSMILHPAESLNYILSPSDTNMSFANMSTEGSSSLNIWNAGGPSSAGHSVDAGNHDETKMELGWPSSPIGGGSADVENMISMQDVDIDLNSTQIDDDQSFSFSLSSNLNDSSQGLDANPFRVGDEASESGLFTHPYVPSFLEHELDPSSSHSHGSSSETVGFLSGDYDDRPGSSLDGRRLACKRKNIEGIPGQSSASGSPHFFHVNENNSVHSVSARTNSSAGVNISGPSSHMPSAGSSVEQLNPRFNTITRGAAPNGYPAAIVAGTAESSQRNFRLRINPSRQHDVYSPTLSSSRDNVHNSSIWLPNEPSSNPIPFNHRPESWPAAIGSSSQNQSHMSVIPGLPRQSNIYPWNGASILRNGSSSGSINSADTLTAAREGAIPRNNPRNDVSVQPVFVPMQETRNLAHDSANWGVANGSPSIGAAGSSSRAGTGSALHSSLGPTWIPPHNPPTQFSRGLAEAVRRTLLASVGSEPQHQRSNFLSQRSGLPSTSHEAVHQSGSTSRGNQRHTLLLDRQSDGSPLPTRSLAGREGRSRMISEIRNALDLMRRGENLRFEDVFMLDHNVLHRVADLHDRHREMRLDVDNMSYEELLALEERIGNVSTGLGEETILKKLKQRKHFTIVAEATAGTEPCCICQEEYVEGVDLGVVECGHDFHTACIKQWLMQKNLCPICKKTALVA